MLPEIKKSILGFLLDESGNCSRKNALRLGVLSLALSAAAGKAFAASSDCSVDKVEDYFNKVGLKGSQLTQPVQITSGGYDCTPTVKLSFSFNQLQDVGIYNSPGTDFVPLEPIDRCATFKCGDLANHLSDASCCEVTDTFEATSYVDLPTVHYHKNALLLDTDDELVLTASHTHEIGDDSPGRVTCVLDDHVSHYNTTGDPCSHDDTDHLSTISADDWVDSEYCGAAKEGYD